MGHKDKDLEKIKDILKIMESHDLAEVEIKHGDDKILVKRSGPQQITAVPMAAGLPLMQPAGSQAVAPTADVDDSLVEIKSPIVGTFYASPGPDSDPYISAGSKVTAQTVVCIIEAMKVMNEVKSEVEGIVTEVLVTDGEALEFGQPIFKVKPV